MAVVSPSFDFVIVFLSVIAKSLDVMKLYIMLVPFLPDIVEHVAESVLDHLIVEYLAKFYHITAEYLAELWSASQRVSSTTSLQSTWPSCCPFWTLKCLAVRHYVPVRDCEVPRRHEIVHHVGSVPSPTLWSTSRRVSLTTSRLIAEYLAKFYHITAEYLAASGRVCGARRRACLLPHHCGAPGRVAARFGH